MYSIPETGFLRLCQIIGQRAITEEQARRNSDANRPNRRARALIVPLIPVSRSTWWAGVKSGRYPSPVKCGRSTLWRVEEIKALIEKIAQDGRQ